MPYQATLTAAIDRIADLGAADVAALTVVPAAARAHAAQARRTLALGEHGVNFAIIDTATRTARPDLSPPVRAALRWAVIADTFGDSLSGEQREALTRPLGHVHA